MKILIADDEDNVRKVFFNQLRYEHDVVQVSSFAEAEKLVSDDLFDAAFVDLRLDPRIEDFSGLKLIESLHQKNPEMIIVAMTSMDDPDLISKCYKLGATDYLFKPLVSSKIPLTLERVKVIRSFIQKQRTQRSPHAVQENTEYTVQTNSPKFQNFLFQLERVSSKSKQLPILIRGESGSGKEIAARHLWALSKNPNRPFVSVNCAVLPENLAESILFGHRKGAFTDAKDNQIGLIDNADGGDFFFDEIGTISKTLQEKLLRVLDKKEIFPLGAAKPKKVSCRFIFASNEPLEDYVKSGKMREDFYNRINVISVDVPPLRDRRDDIPQLARFLLDRSGFSNVLSEDALKACTEYAWPGNIRTLENVLVSAAVFSDNIEISETELRKALNSKAVSSLPTLDALQIEESELVGNFEQLTNHFEKRLISFALNKFDQNESRSAHFLGISRGRLQGKRKALQV